MARALRKIVEQTVALSPQDMILAVWLAHYLVRDCADLGNECAVSESILRIPNEDLPRGRVTEPVFYAALEKARAIRQGRI